MNIGGTTTLVQGISGGLNVAGASTFSTGLSVSGGLFKVYNGMTITGASTFSTGLSVSGGLLNVYNGASITGASTFASGLSVGGGSLKVYNGATITGASAFANGLTILSGGLNVLLGGLNVITGASTFASGLNISGGLNVTGASTFSSGLSVSGGLLNIYNGASITGASTFASGLSVSGGLLNIYNGASITGASTFASGLSVSGGLLNIYNGASITGASTFASGLSVSGGLFKVYNGMTITGASTFSSGLSVSGGLLNVYNGINQNQVSIGTGAGTQGSDSIAIGNNARSSALGASSVAVGPSAGQSGSGVNTVSIGNQAGQINQSNAAIAIGNLAGNSQQNESAVAVGYLAGYTSQDSYAVAIGIQAGKSFQFSSAVAIGSQAGNQSQGSYSVAIGYLAGYTQQGSNAIAIGNKAGQNTQGSYSIAIGYNTGVNSQGVYSISIGYYANNTSSVSNSIVLNASTTPLNAVNTNACYISPIRTNPASAYTTGLPVGFYPYTPVYLLGYTTGGEIVKTNLNIDPSGALHNTINYVFIPASDNGTNTNRLLYDSVGVFNETRSGSGNYNLPTANNNISSYITLINKTNSSIKLGADYTYFYNLNANIYVQPYLTYEFFSAPDGSAWNLKQNTVYDHSNNILYIGNLGNSQSNTKQNNIILNATTSTITTSYSSACYISPIRKNNTTSVLCYDTSTNEVSYATGKTFIIDHPDKPETHYLVHACLEGPEAGVYYRGKGIITNNNVISISLPDYVENLASDFTIQITPIHEEFSSYFFLSFLFFLYSLFIPRIYKTTEVKNNAFQVYGPNGSFYWHVYGKRNSITVEPRKQDIHVYGNGPYKYYKEL